MINLLFFVECASENILKIGQYLAKARTRVSFFLKTSIVTCLSRAEKSKYSMFHSTKYQKVYVAEKETNI